MTILMKNI